MEAKVKDESLLASAYEESRGQKSYLSIFMTFLINIDDAEDGEKYLDTKLSLVASEGRV